MPRPPRLEVLKFYGLTVSMHFSLILCLSNLATTESHDTLQRGHWWNPENMQSSTWYSLFQRVIKSPGFGNFPRARLLKPLLFAMIQLQNKTQHYYGALPYCSGLGSTSHICQGWRSGGKIRLELVLITTCQGQYLKSLLAVERLYLVF